MQKTITDEAAKSFVGLMIGETLKGEAIDLTGYEFEVTGGSDDCGFPMRKGVQGARKRVLIAPGVGFHSKRKGIRKRKTICGEAITDKISQINLKITKMGKKNIFEEKKEEAKEGEAPKAEAKEVPKEKKKEVPKEKKEDKKE